jgi:hypothetical protein
VAGLFGMNVSLVRLYRTDILCLRTVDEPSGSVPIRFLCHVRVIVCCCNICGVARLAEVSLVFMQPCSQINVVHFPGSPRFGKSACLIRTTTRKPRVPGCLFPFDDGKPMAGYDVGRIFYHTMKRYSLISIHLHDVLRTLQHFHYFIALCTEFYFGYQPL